MKNINIWVITISLLGFVSCGSNSKKEVVKEEAKKVEGRVFHKSFVLMNASSGRSPEWIEMPSSGDMSNEAKKNRYFVSESANKNKRLCLKSAHTRATARIAAEIAQFIKNTYGESTQGDEDEVTAYMEESLASETQSFIVGARVYKTYWEKRGYKESLGASSNLIRYNCFALVKMSKNHLKKAIKNSTAKLYTSINDPEVKQNTKKILKDAGDAFNKLDKPVEIKN